MRCWQFGLFLLFSLVSLDVWAQDLPDIERLLEGNDILNTEDGYEEMVDILSNLYSEYHLDRKSTRLNSSHVSESRMPSSA